jgi:hypothetical protein
MKANELRIGNLVQYSDTKEVANIYQIEHRYKSVYRINDLNDNNQIEPIPLTEEWLLKFGFEKDERYGDKVSVIEIKKCKEFILMFDDRDESYFLCDTDVDTCLKHVHQLQNLYFCLTGTELEIKE